MILPESVLTKHQVKKMSKIVEKNPSIDINIRYDDQCKNGHNSFSITGTYWKIYDRRKDCGDEFGCIHERIGKFFPKLEKYLKWHLCSSDGPMHYITNTTYHAGDRDCHGLRKGEPYLFSHGLKFADSVTLPINTEFWKYLKEQYEIGVREFTVKSMGHESDGRTYNSRFTFEGYDVEWYKCPFKTEFMAEEVAKALATKPVEFVRYPTAWSEGKERDLGAARSCAVWPDATDEQLCLPREELTMLLEARLPALMGEFKKDMEELGFVY